MERSEDTQRYDWMKCDTDTEEFGKTSYNMSEHFLRSYNGHGSRRFGSYVFKDQVGEGFNFMLTLCTPL